MYKRYLFILLFFTSTLFSACAVTDFAGGLFEDVTTYFNVYYNAKTQFNEALEEVKQQQTEIFSTKPYVPPGGAVTKFLNVIEKCSKILQYSSTSSYVDDALMMIGQCYYYQNEYPSAIRKFTELRDNFPNSSLNLDARLWIAKSNARSNDLEKAVDGLQNLIKIAEEEDEEDILMEAYIEMMKISLSKNEYEKAIDFGNKFIQVSNDDEKSSQVMLEIGLTYTKLNLIEKAVEAFDRVSDYSPTYKTLFRSRLEFAKLNRQLKNFELALEVLDDLKSETIFEEFYDQVELEKGFNYLARGEIEDALQKFHYIDTTFSSKESGGVAQYELGQYVEHNLYNLDSAKYFYDRASRSQAPQEIVQNASKKSLLLSKRKNLWENINNLNVQIEKLLTFPIDSSKSIYDEFVVDSTMLNDSVYVAELKELMLEKQKADSLKLIKLSTDSVTYRQNLKNVDSIKVAVAKLKFDLGSLFYSDFAWPDSAFPYFKYVVDSFSNQSFSQRALYALAIYYAASDSTEIADSLFRLIYDKYPANEIVSAVAKKLNLPPKRSLEGKPDDVYYQAELQMQSGNFLEAIKTLEYLISHHPNSDYVPKSYLLIGHIYEDKLQLYDSAASAYKVLKEKYPYSLYNQKSSQKLFAYEEEKQKIEQAKKLEEERLKKELEDKKKIEEEKKLEQTLKVEHPVYGAEQKRTKKDSIKTKTGIIDTLKIPVDSSQIKFDSTLVPIDSTEIERE